MSNFYVFRANTCYVLSMSHYGYDLYTFKCMSVFVYVDMSPKTAPAKGKRSKTKASITDEIGSRFASRVRMATGHTPPLNPSLIAAGEAGFEKCFPETIYKNCFFNMCYNQRTVIVE